MSGLNFNENQKLVLCVLIGVSLIGLAVSQMRHGWFSSTEIKLSEPAESNWPEGFRGAATNQAQNARVSSAKVVFQVAGCVKRPGVYSLRENSRVIDAIKAAGGPKDDADTEAINLAAKIVDGSRIYVPAKGECSFGQVGGSRSLHTSATQNRSVQARQLVGNQGVVVNINTADLAELDLLPGVGPVTAQRIIDYRRQIGRFTSVDQLLDVKGIGPKKLEQMRPCVAL